MNNGLQVNYDSISNVVSTINNTLKELNEAAETYVQAFANEAKDYWACQDAVNFFDGLKTDFDMLQGEVNSAFSGVSTALNNSIDAINTAMSSNHSHVSISLDPIVLKVSVGLYIQGTSIQGADDEKIATFITKLTSFDEAAKQTLEKLRTTASQENGLMVNGVNQLDAPITSLKGTISAKISNLVQQGQDAIKQTVATYADGKEKIRAYWSSVGAQ